MGWVVPLIALALVVIGLSGCHRRLEEAEADADATTGTNPVGSAAQPCGPGGCDTFRDEVDELLQDSATGREALQYLRDHNIPVVVVNDGRGSRYSNMDRRIYLDRGDGVERAALALVHETEHRRRLDRGDRPDIRTATRETYVEGMIEEETSATLAALRTREELTGEDHPGMQNVSYPGASDYAEGQQTERDAWAQSHPGATEEELDEAGRAGGEDAVRSGFYNGDYTTTDAATGQDQSYSDYYGSAWDDAHPRRSGLGG